MSLDDTVNLERLATAFEKIAASLAERNIIEREKMARQFPLEKPKRAAEIIDPKAEKEREFSDHADPEWFRETERAVPSRFQERLDAAKTSKPRSSEPARARTAPVPKTQ
jgi:hypothetical protein